MNATVVQIAKNAGRLVPAALRLAARRRLEARALRARQRGAVAQLVQAAQDVSRACLADVRTPEDWTRQRPELRRQLAFMLGLDPLPEPPPAPPVVAGVEERPEYRIEKLVFSCLPGMHMTGNLYLPRAVRGPASCILYLCGHRTHPRGAKTQYQDRVLWYPAHGFVCLVLDSLNNGEVPGWHHGLQNLNRWDWLSLGYTPAGLEIWNAMRALDYLETRPEVDARRIGATGISGGGVMTMLLAALDERIQAAAPSCSTYTVGDQAARNLLRWQCDCTFYPNVYRLDYPAVAALVAPRPLLITAGRQDPIFPPSGAREVYRQAKRIFELCGARDSVRLVESNAGHTDPPLFLRESRQWMCRRLHPDPETVLPKVAEAPPAPAPAEVLACFTAPPRESANYDVHEHFIRPPVSRPPNSPTEWDVRKKQIAAGLKSTTFAWFPAKPPPVVARRLPGSKSKLGGCEGFARWSEWLLETEPGATVHVFRYEPLAAVPERSPLLVVRGAGDVAGVLDDEWLPVLERRPVIAVHPRLGEEVLSAADRARWERTAALSGRTLASLQIWDVLQTLAWALANDPSVPATIYGHGEAGIVGLYAALFAPAVGQVVLRDPPDSHRSGPALLTVLRTADLPEVAATLAPRMLTWLSDPAPAYDFTRRVYCLCGAEDRFRRVPALATAVSRVQDAKEERL